MLKWRGKIGDRSTRREGLLTVLEGTLAEFSSFLLELLDGTLVDTTALVDQVTSGGRLAGIDVADNDDVNVGLLLSHFFEATVRGEMSAHCASEDRAHPGRGEISTVALDMANSKFTACQNEFELSRLLYAAETTRKKRQ